MPDDLLRAVLENHADDGVRLIYADSIAGDDPDRAEFIRLQIALVQKYHAAGDRVRWKEFQAGGEYERMRSREYELMAKWSPGRQGCNGKHWLDFIPAMRPFCNVSEGDHDGTASGKLKTKRLPRHHQGGWDGGTERAPMLAGFRRGFVWEIISPMATFMVAAKDIFTNQPVTKVTISDKSPEGGRWYAGPVTSAGLFEVGMGPAEATLPDELALGKVYKQFRSDEDAMKALSEACVIYGRRLAGLSEKSHV